MRHTGSQLALQHVLHFLKKCCIKWALCRVCAKHFVASVAQFQNSDTSAHPAALSWAPGTKSPGLVGR